MKAAINKHRVFFALLPDDEIASHLLALGRHVVARGGGRLTPLPNLHLTLAFIGSVTSTQMDTLVTCAQSVSGGFLAPRGRALGGLPFAAVSPAPSFCEFTSNEVCAAFRCAALDISRPAQKRFIGGGLAYDAGVPTFCAACDACALGTVCIIATSRFTARLVCA